MDESICPRWENQAHCPWPQGSKIIIIIIPRQIWQTNHIFHLHWLLWQELFTLCQVQIDASLYVMSQISFVITTTVSLQLNLRIWTHSNVTWNNSSISCNSMQHVRAYPPAYPHCQMFDQNNSSSKALLFNRRILVVLNWEEKDNSIFALNKSHQHQNLSPCTGEWGRTSRLFGDAHHGQVSEYWTHDLGYHEEVNDNQGTF